MSINFLARETFLFLALFLALSMDGQDQKAPDLQSVCLYENIQNSPQIAIDAFCAIFQVSNCVFNGLTGNAIDFSNSNLVPITDARLQINDNSFTNCATTGGQKKIGAIYIAYVSQTYFDFLPNTDYIVSSCSFTGCAQSVYISAETKNQVFPVKYLSIESPCKLPLKPGNLGDQVAINLYVGASREITDCSNLNFTNARSGTQRFAYIESNAALCYVNINNVNTKSLIYKCGSREDCIMNCMNIQSITFDQSGTGRSIIETASDLMIQNALIINIENVDEAYLCRRLIEKVTFQNCYTTMPISRVINGEYKGSFTFVENLARLSYSDYGCQFSFKPSEKFTESSKFTESHTFSKSMQFKKSIIFSPSTKFTKSQAFSSSKMFSSSSRFSSSKQFSSSSNFSPSDKFTKSSIFIATRGFTHSINFTPSSNFSPSDKFTKSSIFIATRGFTYSINFTLSSKFSPSDFLPTASFTPSSIFTPSDSKYVYFLRQSRLAGLPSKTSQYGSLSTTEVAAISTSVIIGIIIAGAILMIFYIRERSKAMADIELPDLLSIPSDSSETTEDCVISLSYSIESRSRENDPFAMDPEYYLNLRD